jgi:hypothetical protein
MARRPTNSPDGKTATVKLASAAGAQVVTVTHLQEPPQIVQQQKKIHLRRMLPLVQEGQEREFHSRSAQAMLRPLEMLAPAASTDEVAVVRNTELTGPAQQRTASNVGEPSVAMNGDVVLYTGNWYAAVSTDGGKTFRFIDPARSFPDPSANSHFCCDQVAQYIAEIDTFVWLLQYGPDTGDNIQRLAFAKTADVAQGRWAAFDITTESLGVEGAFLDFPDLAVGANCLYVTTNIFGPGSGVGSAVVRIPFAGIASGDLTAQHFVSKELQSFRVAQNCGTTAFFAAHQDTSTLAVFSWKEADDAPVQKSVGVARWIGGNGYISRIDSSGGRWLDRADPRITGATLTSKELWFAWSVDRNSNHRPRPFVQIARLDAANLTLIDNINIFDANSATCYGALATNANDEIGISYMIGGGPRFPTHVVGILTGSRKDVIVAVGQRGPLPDQGGKMEWGDYLTIRPVFPARKLFAATGFTMKAPGQGTNRDVTPRFVMFGRTSDAGPSAAPGVAGGQTVGTPVTGGTVTSGVVTGGAGGAGDQTGTSAQFDIDSLPLVSPQVAAVIKAAAMAAGQHAFAAEEALLQPRLVTKPGVERWPVKTGTDHDVALVGKNIIGGRDLGAGIVQATVEELIRIPRSADMTPPTRLFAQFQDRRKSPVETTIWQIDAHIIAMKLEGDGDYHLVLQGSSGQTMIGEIPIPHPPFVEKSSPWTANMLAARNAIDQTLLAKLSPAEFVQLDDTLVPRDSLPPGSHPLSMPAVLPQFQTPQEGEEAMLPTFKTRISPTPARITGVGFFDKVHGQMGVSLLNGIELHAILKIEWL